MSEYTKERFTSRGTKDPQTLAKVDVDQGQHHQYHPHQQSIQARKKENENVDCPKQQMEDEKIEDGSTMVHSTVALAIAPSESYLPTHPIVRSAA
eukprot:3036846-Amphidinium_carterae.1